MTAWVHKGWIITVTESGRFLSTDPIDNDSRQVFDDSLAGCKKKIDQMENKREKQKAEKISLPIVTDKGETRLVTGLNLHSGHLLGLPQESYSYHKVYPDTPWVREQLQKIEALQLQLRPLQNRLEKVALKLRHDVETPEQYAARLTELKADYTKKLMDAERIAEEEFEVNHAHQEIEVML